MQHQKPGNEILQLARDDLLAYCSLTNEKYRCPEHIIRLAELLERVERGDLRRLIITFPPRHGKSMLCSEFFPAWYMGRNPDRQFITATYASELAETFGRRVRDQVTSPLFREIFPKAEVRRDTRSVTRMVTTVGGSYYGVGVGGAITGKGGDIIFIDDPVKDRAMADSEGQLEKIYDWYRSTLYSRLERPIVESGEFYDGFENAMVIIMTRWSENDLVGRVLADQKHENWTVVNLPAIENENTDVESALWPEKYPLEALKEIRETMRNEGSLYDWHCLYQQDPIPKDGIIFKPEWIQDGLAEEYAASYIAVDPAIGEKEQNDETAICVLQCDFADPTTIYETITHHGRWSFPEQLKMIKMVFETTEPKPEYIGIEDVAYQRALGQALEMIGLPVVLLKADTDKVRRAVSITHLLSTGKVKVNTPELKKQLLRFRGKEEANDLVDAFVHGLKMLQSYAQPAFEKKEDRYEGKTFEQIFFMRAMEQEKIQDMGHEPEVIEFDHSNTPTDGEFY